MADDKIPVSLKFDPDFLQQIDSFRFEHWFPNRTATIMWLLQWALKQEPQPPALKDRVGARD